MGRLAAIFNCSEQRAMLKFQLAVLTIIGGKLLAVTYNLEGDQCCALVAYDTIKDCESWLVDHFDHLSYPGLTQELNYCVATLLDEKETYKGMNAEVLMVDLRDKAKVILRGGVEYYKNTIMVKLGPDVELYKTCSFSNPIVACTTLHDMMHVMESPDTLVEFKEAV